MSLPSYRDYVMTGNPWIPSLPRHWSLSALGTIGQFLKGRGGSKQDSSESGVPCIRYGELYTKFAYVIREAVGFVPEELAIGYVPVQRGDILFAASGEDMADIGRSAALLTDQRTVCGGDLVVLRPTREVVPEFLGYASDCSVAKSQKASAGRGTTVKHIYPDELKRVVLALPSLPEQQAISLLLEREIAKIDDLIAEQESLIALLQEKRQAVISHAVTKGLDPNVPMKDSDTEWIGAIPDHWRTMRGKSVFSELTVGIVVEPSKFYVDDGVPALRSLNVRPGRIALDDLVRISSSGHALHRKSALRAGDIVAVRTGQPGTAAVVPIELDGCNCIDLLVLRQHPENSSAFLCWALQSDSTLAQFQVGSGGAIQQHFNVSAARELRFAIPPREEQDAVVDYLDLATERFERMLTDSARSIDLLRERRSALITAAVTGQIDVRGLVETAA